MHFAQENALKMAFAKWCQFRLCINELKACESEFEMTIVSLHVHRYSWDFNMLFLICFVLRMRSINLLIYSHEGSCTCNTSHVVLVCLIPAPILYAMKQKKVRFFVYPGNRQIIGAVLSFHAFELNSPNMLYWKCCVLPFKCIVCDRKILFLIQMSS